MLHEILSIIMANFMVCLAKKKWWSTWRCLIARPETCRWKKQCKNILLINNIKQDMFDYILHIHLWWHNIFAQYILWWHNIYAQYIYTIKSKTKFNSIQTCYESCLNESYFYITLYCFIVKMSTLNWPMYSFLHLKLHLATSGWQDLFFSLKHKECVWKKEKDDWCLWPRHNVEFIYMFVRELLCYISYSGRPR